MAKRRHQERDRRIAEQRRDGATAAELSAEYGISQTTIYGILAGEGVIGERGRRRKIRICQREECQKPIWRNRNGKYCTETCWRIAQKEQRGYCAYKPCGKSLEKLRNQKFCSRACYRASERELFAQALAECALPGCTNRVNRIGNQFCSRECTKRYRKDRAFNGHPCARPGCGRFTATYSQKYCSAECRAAVLRAPGGAADIRDERNRRRGGRKCLGCECPMDHEPLLRLRCEPCQYEHRRAQQREYDHNRRARRRAADAAKKKGVPQDAPETAI